MHHCTTTSGNRDVWKHTVWPLQHGSANVYAVLSGVPWRAIISITVATSQARARHISKYSPTALFTYLSCFDTTATEQLASTGSMHDYDDGRSKANATLPVKTPFITWLFELDWLTGELSKNSGRDLGSAPPDAMGMRREAGSEVWGWYFFVAKIIDLTLWRPLLSYGYLSVRVPGCQKLQMTA